jgi:hypothetical protein
MVRQRRAAVCAIVHKPRGDPGGRSHTGRGPAARVRCNMRRMAKRQNDDLRQWAVIGAEHRLLQIAEEAAAIFQAFPELRDRGFMADESKSATTRRRGKTRSGAAAKPRPRRQLSAAGRKRIGDAQRRRWAKQKRAAQKAKRA